MMIESNGIASTPVNIVAAEQLRVSKTHTVQTDATVLTEATAFKEAIK